MAAGLEDVVETDQVRLDIRIGIGNRIPHSGLCSQIHHDLRLIRLKNPIDSSLVRNIALNVMIGDALRHQLLQLFLAPRLQPDVIIVVLVVNIDNGSPFGICKQPFDQIAADKPRTTSYQDTFVIQINLFHIP